MQLSPAAAVQCAWQLLHTIIRGSSSDIYKGGLHSSCCNDPPSPSLCISKLLATATSHALACFIPLLLLSLLPAWVSGDPDPCPDPASKSLLRSFLPHLLNPSLPALSASLCACEDKKKKNLAASWPPRFSMQEKGG